MLNGVLLVPFSIDGEGTWLHYCYDWFIDALVEVVDGLHWSGGFTVEELTGAFLVDFQGSSPPGWTNSAIC